MPNIFSRLRARFSREREPEKAIDVFKRENIEEKPVETREPLHHADIPPKLIKQRHIEDLVIKVGNIADRPSDGGTHIKAFFAKDESKLYIWNATNDAWESATLS